MAKPSPQSRAAAGSLVNNAMPATFDQDVAVEVERLRVRQAARRQFDAEQAGPAPVYDVATLGEVLGRPPGPLHRVDGLIPAEANTIVVAQHKVGKSTYELNLARSLLTGERFLGTFDVVPVTGTVALLNYEVSAAQLARWADEVGVPHDRLIVVNLRGVPNPFRDNTGRDTLASELRRRRVEVVIVDTFGRAFPGENQNDPSEVGRYLADLDLWARTGVGAADIVVTVHTGWEGERARGASALGDWPDAIITLTKGAEGYRYMKAEGRDVAVDEDRLNHDERTRRLTMSGCGSRRDQAKADNLDPLVLPVVEFINKHPEGVSGNRIDTELSKLGSHRRGTGAEVASRAVGRGLITEDDLDDKRPGKPHNFYSAPASPASPNLPGGGR